MSKSSNSAKVECLKVWMTTLKPVNKPKHLKEQDEKPDYKVNVKGFKTR